MRHPTGVGYLTWLESQQNGEFHFIKIIRLFENDFTSSRWDLTEAELFFSMLTVFLGLPHLGEISLASVHFYNYFMKKYNKKIL